MLIPKMYVSSNALEVLFISHMKSKVGVPHWLVALQAPTTHSSLILNMWLPRLLGVLESGQGAKQMS